MYIFITTTQGKNAYLAPRSDGTYPVFNHSGRDLYSTVSRAESCQQPRDLHAGMTATTVTDLIDLSVVAVVFRLCRSYYQA